ncbi:MAG: metal-sensitive transcriptional regulator [Phycisphaeraceae bacterium]|nr:metal-sensitive transcriptional regulator [Phycisphaeraceae bacterium]MBX3387617.1 metal-sensitive transcriptional regulator [Phycisphaeraceae bacterium]
MKKRETAKNGRGGKGAAATPDRSAAACCGCGVAAGLEAARDGVGPGAHASGVDAALKSANLKHLRRIEGQVRGIAAMIDEDRYCADIIQQCAAVQESLRSVARNLLRNHLTHCANHALHGDKTKQAAMVEELVELVGRIAR